MYGLTGIEDLLARFDQRTLETQEMVRKALETISEVRSYQAGQKEPETALKSLISMKDLCKRLDLSEPSVRKLIRKGKIKSIRVGNNIRFDPNEVIGNLKTEGGD